jgi:hypothetical protein
MRKLALVLAAGAALLSAPVAVQARDKLSGEAKLAKILEGREAGKPVDCIPLNASRETRIIDKTAIVYDSGSVIYVNRPAHPQSLDDDAIMVTEPHAGQLCRLDTVRLHDRSGFWYRGFVGLDKFVPYRKVALRD